MAHLAFHFNLVNRLYFHYQSLKLDITFCLVKHNDCKRLHSGRKKVWMNACKCTFSSFTLGGVTQVMVLTVTMKRYTLQTRAY